MVHYVVLSVNPGINCAHIDSNIVKANNRKCDKYQNLINDIEANGFIVSFNAIEISSRGLITKKNSDNLKAMLCLKSRELKNLCQTLQKVAIVASYIIFNSKYERDWINPSLVSF